MTVYYVGEAGTNYYHSVFFTREKAERLRLYLNRKVGYKLFETSKANVCLFSPEWHQAQRHEK